eukprot:8057287-Pyramimonas_sp.AAC.1
MRATVIKDPRGRPGLNTDTEKVILKILLSHLVTREFDILLSIIYGRHMSMSSLRDGNTQAGM